MLDKNSRLRNLAMAYAAGDIDSKQYRQERSLLLVEITKGKGGGERDTSSVIAERAGERTLKPVILIFIFAIALLGVILAVVFMMPDPDENSKTTTEIPSVSALSVEPDENDESDEDANRYDVNLSPEQLVKSFSSRGNWSQEAIADFRKKWSSFNLEEIEEARETVWFQDFGELLGLFWAAQKERVKEYQLDSDYSYLEELADYLDLNLEKHGPGQENITSEELTVPVKNIEEKTEEKIPQKTETKALEIEKPAVESPPDIEGIAKEKIYISWEEPVIKQLEKNKFVWTISFNASEDGVTILVKDYPNFNMQLFRLDLQGDTYMIQKEFENHEQAHEFSVNVIEIFKKIQK